MRWDFWRKDTEQGDGAASGGAADKRGDPAATLKIRARRRLIGAAALLLAVIVIVPAVLDPRPKPLPDSIPIEIPGEKTPFTPRLSLPPLPEPIGAAPPPETAPEPPAPADSKAEAKSDSAKKPLTEKTPAEKSAQTKAAEAKAADAKRARDILEGRADGSDKATKSASTKPAPTNARFLLQAAALSSETAARELSDRIGAAGLKSYVEKIDTKEGARFRVRVGPYANRDDAEQARSRLRALGVNANLVSA
jgi:DedD protein